MVFVNEIADIVHNVVDEFGGASNKNIGDCFLFVWKFALEDCIEKPEEARFYVEKNQKTRALAELAFMSFVKVQSSITKSSRLEKYRHNSTLVTKLAGMSSEYKIKMGFGLHLGWAIESAIGSEFKIDASYLSPHVNVASRLEALTKLYGVTMLVSDEVVDMLRDPLQGFLRMVDRVRIKGLQEAIYIYTIDLHVMSLNIEDDGQIEATGISKKKHRIQARNDKERKRKDYITGKVTLKSFLESQADFIQMRRVFRPEFYTLWDQGIYYYMCGDFSEAKEVFEKTEKFLQPEHTDLLSKKMIEIMIEMGMEKPMDWDQGRLLADADY